MKVELGNYVDIVNEREKISEARLENYVSTENLLPNRRGIIFPAKSLPNSKFVQSFKKGDILVSNIRPYFKKIWHANLDGCRSGDVLDFRTNNKKLLQDYLYVLLQTDAFFTYVTTTSKGTKMPRGDKSAIKQFKFELPNVEMQKKIAYKIKLIEEKITLNRKINDNLLELARTYYQSIIDTRDKEKQMISNIADSVVTGKTPSTKDESNYGYDVPFITIPDMHSQVFTTQTARYLSKKGADSQIKKYLPPYTLSVSSIGTPGLVTINPVEAQTNQQINSIIAEKEKIWYLFLAFDSLKKYIKNMGSGGSTILNLNKSNFKKIEIDWPSNNDTLVEINKFLDPIFMSILNNQQEIDNLVIIRDYLLSELL